MNIKEFAALRVGDKIENHATGDYQRWRSGRDNDQRRAGRVGTAP